eukprot:m.208933 g.208933  ORF g.208933 m.208933 type:complete len:119 (+) comp25432_c3_seq2:163-519(+)
MSEIATVVPFHFHTSVNFSEEASTNNLLWDETASEAQTHRVGGGLPARGTSLSIEQAHGGNRAVTACSRERESVCECVCADTDAHTTTKVQSRYQNGVLQFDPSALWAGGYNGATWQA